MQISTAQNTSSAPSPPSSEVLSRRFRISESLREGQGISTLRAEELSTGGEVILKTVAESALPLSARFRLEHEARILREISSPKLVAPLEVGRQEGLLYVAARWTAGITLQERLQRGPLQLSEVLAVAQSLLEALQEAHARGVLHRSLKPSNVVLDTSPVRRALLIDFGLSRSARLSGPSHAYPVDAVRYMSPEQTGVLDHDVGERSDLYSLGVLLWECVTGRPPFQAKSIGELLREHLSVVPADPLSLGFTVPRALGELIARLLKKDPRDRYQSAAGALADVQQISEAVENGATDPTVVIGARDARSTLTEPSFIGRTAELAELERELDRAQVGSGGMVLLAAPSGMGKTRLLEELGQRAALRGAWVLRGRSVAGATQRPFQLLEAVVSEVLHAARADPAFAEAVCRKVGGRAAALCTALPSLAELFGGGEGGDLGPEAHGQVRTVAALAAFLEALGSESRPAVLLLDDCQWADELTLRLIAEWSRRVAARPRRFALTVVAYRSEEVSERHPLAGLVAPRRLALAPLGSEEVTLLVDSIAGRVPQEIRQIVLELSGGHPFMASAVLHGLVETGAMISGPGGWRIDPGALEAAQSSSRAAGLLVQRLELLPPDTLRFLSVGAILGREFELELAAELSGHPLGVLIPLVDQARRRQIVWSNASGSRCTFFHDRIREALLARLGEEERRTLHRRAALAIEAKDPRRVFELAHHFDAAGESLQALPHALVAAALARKRHALEIAERQYRIAACADADRATREQIAEGLGDVLMLRGHYAEARPELERVRTLAVDRFTQARIEGKLGELAFKQGEVREASEAIERALRLLGRYVPRSLVGFLVLTLWEALIQVLHTLLPGWFVGRRSMDTAGPDIAAVQQFNRLQYPYYFHRGFLPTFWAHLRTLNLAERYPPTPELAIVYGNHGIAMTTLPAFGRAVHYAERGLAIQRQLGDDWHLGVSLGYLGIVLYAASRFHDALAASREASQLLDRTGDRWEMNNALAHEARSLLGLGDLPGALAVARRRYELGREIGDTHAEDSSLELWAKATGGRIPEELMAPALRRGADDVLRMQFALRAEAVRLMAVQRPLEAAARLEEAERVVHAGAQRGEYVTPVPVMLAGALRRAATETAGLPEKRRQELLARARRAARRGLRQARKFQNSLPAALREMAQVTELDGRPGRARALLDQALAVADRQKARYERALTLKVRGELGVSWHWPSASADLDEARRELRAMGAEFELGEAEGASPDATALSLVDRFDAVLSSGRAIASALSRPAVFEAVRDAAAVLLRGEACELIELGPGGAVEPLDAPGEPIAALHRHLAREAMSALRPVVLEELPDATRAAAELSGVRSALCAPVVARSQVVACFAVIHRRVQGLFSAEEVRLAEFIAALAGAALENAAGFEQVESLSRSLEQRVAQRTVELAEKVGELLTTRDQLVQAEKLALAGKLAAGLAHEINNPAAALRSNLELAQYQLTKLAALPLDGPAHAELLKAVGEELQDSLEGINRISDLVRSFHQLAHAQRARPGRIELKALLERCVQELSLSHPAEAGRVSLQPIPKAYARGSFEDCKAAVLGLLRFAARPGAGDAQPVTIGAEVEPEAVRISLTAPSLELSEEERGNIFDPFFDVDETKGRRVRLELGLLLASQLLQANGGRVTVTGAPGAGTVFELRFPLADGTYDAP